MGLIPSILAAPQRETPQMLSPTPPRAAPSPGLVADQLHSLHGLIVALHGSAQAAGLPHAAINGLHYLAEDAAGVLADAREYVGRPRVPA
jgi:hypothetical protein